MVIWRIQFGRKLRDTKILAGAGRHAGVHVVISRTAAPSTNAAAAAAAAAAMEIVAEPHHFIRHPAPSLPRLRAF